MTTTDQLVQRSGAPGDRPVTEVDSADLPPPEPLRKTLSRLADLPDDRVLVQYNDRAPQHLYPQLAERGYEYETIDRDDDVVTVIWVP